MPVTWKTVFNTLKVIDKLKKPTVKQVDEITSKAFGLSIASLQVLAGALASQSNWIDLAQRDSRLSKACENKKVLAILKSLFVLSKPRAINFVTFEHILIQRAHSASGVLNWKKTPHVVRIRKNKIMNWGTLNSNIVNVVTLDAGDDPVLLVPSQDLLQDVVFFACDRLCKEADKILRHPKRLSGSAAQLLSFHFWHELYYVAASISGSGEYECFTYTERVPCTAYKLTRASMKKSGFVAMRAGRVPYQGE